MKHFLLFTLCLGLSFQALAQPKLVDSERFSLEPGVETIDGIPSPKEFLDYELGENFTVYAHIVEYFKTLSEASPRVSLNKYGETYEGKPLYNIIISSEENMGNIDAIRGLAKTPVKS